MTFSLATTASINTLTSAELVPRVTTRRQSMGKRRMRAIRAVQTVATPCPGTGKDYNPEANASPEARDLIAKTMEFIETGTGFGTAARPEMFAEDFVFRGPVIGPLCKKDYLYTLGVNKVYEAFPDLHSGAFGYSVDPREPNRVWFFTRYTGTNTGTITLGPLELAPTGAVVDGAPEANSVMFDDEGKVRLLTVGYNVDADAGTSEGAGALVGILNACGIRLPSGAVFKATQALGTRAANLLPDGALIRSVSSEDDIPEWYKAYCPARRGAQGVY